MSKRLVLGLGVLVLCLSFVAYWRLGNTNYAEEVKITDTSNEESSEEIKEKTTEEGKENSDVEETKISKDEDTNSNTENTETSTDENSDLVTDSEISGNSVNNNEGVVVIKEGIQEKKQKYYNAIKSIWENESNFISTLNEEELKDYPDSPESVARSEANRLISEHKEDSDIIEDCLNKVLNGEGLN